jgi:hypothetical protein
MDVLLGGYTTGRVPHDAVSLPAKCSAFLRLRSDTIDTACAMCNGRRMGPWCMGQGGEV